MTLEFLPAAEQELAEATAHYEETELGLGVRFREEVQSTAAAILLHPLLYRVFLITWPMSCAVRGCVSLPLVTARVNQATSATACARHPPPNNALQRTEAGGGPASDLGA
jgi:hypothetical protein